MRRRTSAVILVLALAASTACSNGDDDTGATAATSPPTADATTGGTTGVTSPAPTAAPTTTPPIELDPATFTVAPGTEQVTVTDAEPGTELVLVTEDGAELQRGTVDEFGSLLFRSVEGGVVVTVRDETSGSEPVKVMTRTDVPDPALYDQTLPAGGYGYLETRDGTTLSVNVVLPGPPDGGPYPTVLEYSGYTPSDPGSPGLATVYNALGYAYVGVNVRGTGCSGGSFRYFEYSQLLDGYDAIETVARQPWVLGGRVGMVGVSYPGISQLFVASTRPPSLAAISPFSVIDDSYNGTVYPGGILNTGFALPWTEARVEEARPEGQQWAAERIDDGDEQCAANQRLRLQNPDLPAEIRANPFYSAELGDAIAPRTFVDEITVPVFVAGAWQDEQTGGRFPTMLDAFSGTEHLYASLVNGLHTESMSPVIFARLIEFLDLYVAGRTPDGDRIAALVPLLAQGVWGTDSVALPPNRFDGMAYEEALAAFESEPPVQVLFEQGAADGFEPAAPMPRWVEHFDAWPVPGAVATSWYLDADARLASDAPTAQEATTSYLALPDGIPATFYEGSSTDIWRADVTWDWQEPAPGTAATFVSEPLTADTMVVGSGSVDLWVTSNLGDTDLEVTLSEVTPDRTEVYVQSGWLRASHRALDDTASTELRPVHTHLEADAAPLPDEEPALARVELFPFAHVFRAGSRLRLSVDAPGGNRAVWEFDTIANGEQVTIFHDAAHPSRVVLPVVTPSEPVPETRPACGALRAQPCRPFPG